MLLDGNISATAAYLLVAYWGVVGLVGWLRIGRVGRFEHLRDPKDVAVVAVWNILDSDKWTDEGIALHKRWLKFLGLAFLSVIPVFLVLDALTS